MVSQSCTLAGLNPVSFQKMKCTFVAVAGVVHSQVTVLVVWCEISPAVWYWLKTWQEAS